MSKEQKEYAARDAWAGLLIYLKLVNTPDKVFSRQTLSTAEPFNPTILEEPIPVDNQSPMSSADSLFCRLLEVEQGVTVKFDSIHGIMRVELPKKHPLAGVFLLLKKMRDAFFILDPDDVRRVDEYLRKEKITTFEEELLRNPDWCLKHVRCYIPEPEEL
ncbi:UNVERIFIED_CONTAM: hypothetical protein HDU68_005503, partial [Siphonaria sp. JEL0065]